MQAWQRGGASNRARARAGADSQVLTPGVLAMAALAGIAAAVFQRHSKRQQHRLQQRGSGVCSDRRAIMIAPAGGRAVRYQAVEGERTGTGDDNDNVSGTESEDLTDVV